jgi:phosphate uptake regulator
MRRKLIQQGGSALTITLPVKWIRKHNLDPNCDVDVAETDDGLLISSDVIKKEKIISLDVTSFDARMIMNLLYQSYRLGYDTIELQFSTEEHYEAIQNTTKRLIGFEITERKKNTCTLQNIAEPDESKFDVMLRRIFLQVISVSESVAEAGKKRENIEKDLKDAKLQIDKLTNYVRRAIMRAKPEGNKATLLYDVVSKLSLICHGYIYLYGYTLKNKCTLNNKTIEHFSATNTLLRTYYDGFYKKDLSLLYNIGVEKVALFKINDSLLESKKDAVVLSYLREIIRHIQMCATVSVGYSLSVE